MTAALNLDWEAFGILQRRAERAGLRLRRFESGGVVRYFLRDRGRSQELCNADDLAAVIARIAAAGIPADARG